jgi:hypothetical protein
MAIHRLSIDEFDEINYDLIAIHTSLEGYRLAYFINQKLPVLLDKNANEIPASSKAGDTWFSRFTYENDETETAWNLIQNKNDIKTPRRKSTTGDLFSLAQAGQTPSAVTDITTRVYLLPEFKKVDYFLKVENPLENTSIIIDRLHTIDRVSTVYTVDASQVKSKNNLIF